MYEIYFVWDGRPSVARMRTRDGALSLARFYERRGGSQINIYKDGYVVER